MESSRNRRLRGLTMFVFDFGVKSLEQSVKLGRLVILISLAIPTLNTTFPKSTTKKQCFYSVFVVRAFFFSCCIDRQSDRKTGVEPRKAVLTLYHLLATPAVDLVPNVLALPFLRTLPTRPRGGFWELGKPVSPYQPPRQAHGEATSACPTASPGMGTNRGVAVTGSKSWLDWHRARRQGPFLTVGGAF